MRGDRAASAAAAGALCRGGMNRWGMSGQPLGASLRAVSQPGMARTVVLTVGLAVALAAAEATHGTVSHTLRTIRRCAAIDGMHQCRVPECT